MKREPSSFAKGQRKATVFDRIAPIYDLFYDYQKNNYRKLLQTIYEPWKLADCPRVIDLGCGTGALCSVFYQLGHEVTGVDLSEKMIAKAKRKQENKVIRFLTANAHEPLPFPAGAFDLAVASFVAHGLKPAERIALYKEMARLSGKLVLLYDYNERRTRIIDLAEWLEGGDYFNFIKVVRQELATVFSEVDVVAANPGSNWYICRP